MKGEKLFYLQIRVLGTIWPSQPIIYRLVILKHLKNNSVLIKNESNQQRKENSLFKIHLAVKLHDSRILTEGNTRPT